MKTTIQTLLLTAALSFTALCGEALVTGEANAKDATGLSAVMEDDITVTNTGLGIIEPRNLTHAQILTMQTELSGKGHYDEAYYKGSLDGLWGPMTAAAVEDFQHDYGLWANGQLTTSTVAQLGVEVRAGADSYSRMTPAAGNNSPRDNSDDHSSSGDSAY